MDSLHRQLVEHVAELVCSLSFAQSETLALELDEHRTPKKIRNLGGSLAPAAVTRLCDLWQRYPVSGAVLADCVRCAARAVRTTSALERVELLYTGPSADTIRRTEQGLLEVIRDARSSLWVVSYALASGVEDILAALRERTEAGVEVRLLLDHRLENSDYSFNRLEKGAPGCELFLWPDEHRVLEGGKHAALHAKCAVADGRRAFVSSANLTGYAMDHNLEVGYLVTGGPTPRTLAGYFDRLVEEGVLLPREG